MANAICVQFQVVFPALPGSPSTVPKVNIECVGCRSVLGQEDHVGKGCRLYKANLSAERRIPEAKCVLETLPTEVIVSAQLLELVNREGVRRFVIHAGQKTGIVVRIPSNAAPVRRILTFLSPSCGLSTRTSVILARVPTTASLLDAR